ncbi:hypothetical protein GBA52_016496 [Prunus armeniaca]|nr:hypothetical protein GBA52_016496 [Prunus armeniaca]
MAESAVTFLLNKISPFFENRVQLLRGVREELVYLRGELERMKAFLRDADVMEESDDELKVWVKQVRDVAHDAEDLLDEFAILQAHNNHGYELYFPFNRLSCSVKNLKAQYRVAWQLRSINAQIQHIFAAYKRLLPKLNAAKGSMFTSSGDTWHDRRGDALLLDNTDVVGIDKPKQKLVSWLVTGASGLPEGVDDKNSNELKAIIKNFLQKRKYLIVLDDVWHTNEWETVKNVLPTGNFGSRVMVTTRKADVAFTSCSESKGKVYHLKPLPADKSWNLFTRKAFQGKPCPPYLYEKCKRILKKCEGLPLAIVAIGGVLATKDTRRIDEWDFICHSLGAEIHGNDKLEDLKKVLDLEAAPLKMFPREILDLFYLSYLSLRKTQVKVIPKGIGNLQNLLTLDLKKTNVTELPLEILKLEKLCHLLVYHLKIESYAHFYSKFGFKAPSSLGDLQSLQKLCFIEANDHGCGMTMRELGKLKNLRRLGIMKLRKQDGLALCLSLEQLTKLRAFSVKSTRENEILDLQHLSSPPQFLERLYLTGRLEELPNWIPSLHSLVKLFLKWSWLKDDPLVRLQDLPNLVHLELLHACDSDMLSFKSGGFKKLKVLGLDKFDNLRCVKVEEGAMPCLEKLTIQRCKSMKRVPSGVKHLSRLKLLEFFEMPSELILKLRPKGGEDYGEVKHVPDVYSACWRDGGWDVYSIESFKEIENATSQAGTVRRCHELRPLWKV